MSRRKWETDTSSIPERGEEANARARELEEKRIRMCRHASNPSKRKPKSRHIHLSMRITKEIRTSLINMPSEWRYLSHCQRGGIQSDVQEPVQGRPDQVAEERRMPDFSCAWDSPS